MRNATRMWVGWVVALAVGAPTAVVAQVKRKVIKLEEISVEGRIQKPEAFYILPRSNLNYQGLDRTDSFLPKIKKSLENDPF